MSIRVTAKKPKRVALIIDSMMAPRRAMMNGVARFMQEHESWSIYLKPPYVTGTLMQWLEDWGGDGILLGNVSADEVSQIKRANIPIVDVAGVHQDTGLHTVRANDYEIGKAGAEHLLERGFKNFAFCELQGAFWGVHRNQGFRESVEAAGCSSDTHLVPKSSAGPTGPEEWDKHQQAMGEWIASLPKPLGIMTTNDFMGRQVLEACLRFGFSVPDMVAVMGADNDEPICRISTPPLSSVMINDEQRGYEASSVLSQLMNGQTPTQKRTLISPAGVKTRASTDVYAFDDDLMVTALRYLREHFHEQTDTTDLANHLNISRSTIERKFRRLLGRTVNDEIIRLRVNHVLKLLTETKLPLKSIATRSGFSSQAYMSSIFRAKTGRTPGSFR